MPSITIACRLGLTQRLILYAKLFLVPAIYQDPLLRLPHFVSVFWNLVPTLERPTMVSLLVTQPARGVGVECKALVVGLDSGRTKVPTLVLDSEAEGAEVERE